MNEQKDEWTYGARAITESGEDRYKNGTFDDVIKWCEEQRKDKDVIEIDYWRVGK